MNDTTERIRPNYLWGIIFASVIAIYLLINLALPNLLTGFARVYVIQPVLWCLLIAGVVLASRRGTGGKLWFNKSFVWIGLLLGAFQVACAVIAGLMTKFGASPYIHQFYPMFLGFLFWASALVGVEFSRAYLLSVFTKRNTTLMLALIALLYTLVSIQLVRFGNLGKDTLFPFLGGSALPLFAENILASLLALVGGPLAAISYRGIMIVFEWFSPILPNLTWIIKAFVGIIAPVIGLVVVQVLYGEAEAKPEAEGVETEAKKRSSMIGWVITAVVAVIILWFSTGLMGIRPVVILSGSMRPTIDVGDIVLVREISIDNIKEDDVIEYMLGNTPYVHRVIDIQQEGNATVLIAKGDDNSSPDPEPVRAEQIKGKVQFRIPKVGWASIGLKNLLGRIF